jgi:hypothetical protein
LSSNVVSALNVTGNTTSGNLISAGLISAVGAILGGSLSVSGNITAGGNLNYQSVTDLVVGDPLIYIGANNTSNLVDLGIVAAANVSGVYQHLGLARDYTDGVWKLFGNVVAEPTTTINWANAIYQPFKSGAITSTGAISASGNITGGNINTAGIVSSIGNVIGGNLNAAGLSLSGKVLLLQPLQLLLLVT